VLLCVRLNLINGYVLLNLVNEVNEVELNQPGQNIELFLDGSVNIELNRTLNFYWTEHTILLDRINSYLNST
jgi:hypothetical protein